MASVNDKVRAAMEARMKNLADIRVLREKLNHAEEEAPRCDAEVVRQLKLAYASNVVYYKGRKYSIQGTDTARSFELRVVDEDAIVLD